MYRTDPKYWDIILSYRSCLKIWTKSFYYLLMWLKTAKWVANSVDPDQMPHFVASDLDLRYLLTTLFLGMLSPLAVNQYSCTFFCQKLTTAFPESVEGWEWPYKIIHNQSPQKNVARTGGDWTHNLLITSRMRIWLSHRHQTYSDNTGYLFLQNQFLSGL